MPAPSSTALAGPDRLALAFLALAGDGPALPAQRSLTRVAAAVAAAVVLALAAPAGWVAPSAKRTDQPAATLGSSKAVVAAADDDDEPGG
jgi:hypothetical protein